MTVIQIQTRSVIRFAIALACVVLGMRWLISSVSIVEVDELGLRQSFGHLERAVLPPGMHVSLPCPFGAILRVPSSRISRLEIGTEADGGARLIVGNGTEMLIVSAVVQYKIGDTVEQLSDYLFRSQESSVLLKHLAEHGLTAATRNAGADELLTIDRSMLATSLRSALTREVERLRLGIEIIGVDIKTISPPSAVAAAYSDVVNARIDAIRQVAEARGHAAMELQRCEMMRDSMLADAQANVSKRLSEIVEEVDRCGALSRADFEWEGLLGQHYFNTVIADTLADRPYALLDRNLPPETPLWLTGKGDE